MRRRRRRATALEQAVDPRFELLVLDLGLPKMDGLEVCRELRNRRPDLPVLMLTARTDEVDFVVGLDAGADDYVGKPFRLAELLARVRALLRRRPPVAEEVLVGGSIVLDTRARRVLVDGEDVVLANREFDLLQFLMARPGQVVNRDELVTQVWGRPTCGHRRPSTCTFRGCAGRSATTSGTGRVTSSRCAAWASGSMPDHPYVPPRGLMRRRIRTSMIGMLLIVGVMLGVPLSVIAWWWIADNAHQDLDLRLKHIAGELIQMEGPAGSSTRLRLPRRAWDCSCPTEASCGSPTTSPRVRNRGPPGDDHDPVGHTGRRARFVDSIDLARRAPSSSRSRQARCAATRPAVS